MDSFIPRQPSQQQIEDALRRSPVVALLGARQIGKTTLARKLASTRQDVTWLDLELPDDQMALSNAQAFLGRCRGLVVIDEIQLRPDLFPLLRALVDRPDLPARFLLLGSSSPDLLRGGSESLAGRIEFISMSPFHLDEVGAEHWEKLWWRGGFPRSWLAEKDEDSHIWRRNFIQTFLERDLRQHGIDMAPASFHRFWVMLSHYHGQTLNIAELSTSFGIDRRSTQRYLDILCGCYLLRQLQPWHENIAKRQVKSPKLYLRDSGLLHALLGLDSPDRLWHSPVLGASWEGFALEQVLASIPHENAWFWGTHGGAELDLLLDIGGTRHGFEFKWSEQPSSSRSMAVALEELKLEHLWVVYPGRHVVPLKERVTLLPITRLKEWGQNR